MSAAIHTVQHMTTTGNDAEMTTATDTILLTHAVGLHARPSVKVTKLAKTFASKVELATSEDGPWTDAKSIVRVMGLKVPQNTILHFRAVGPDAEPAVEALVALVANDFEGAPE
jgi:phosphocarrier protein